MTFITFIISQAVSTAVHSFTMITACFNSLNGCVIIPTMSNNCTNLIGGLSFLNKEISEVQIPDGSVCSFYG
ncbi:hypothetical protein J3R30DRAFT_3713788 [Lentinula aciculospora]|uniref:Secreted protein n=1 Tax=Lentinula aciculospora TaxID=153920 RepID=A0A9W9DGI6_9AGAR|nr:hypothetical protein J3R30DRAFT_3713788 [Lentinula aciculospora]